MQEHNETHNARKHEKVEKYSLASMSTTEIVIMYKTKNVSKLLGKKGPLLGMYLVETVSCPLEALTPRKNFCQDKKCQATIRKEGALARHVLGENRFMPTRKPPSATPKKGLEGLVRVIVP